MIKKILIILVVLAMAAFLALNIFARKAPGLLREAIQKSLNKKVNIGTIDYRFPGLFELEGFEVEEHAPFEGEISFYADHIRLEVSPLSLSQRALIVDNIEVNNAKIFIRQLSGKLSHAFSNMTAKSGSGDTAGGPAAGEAPSKTTLPLEIHRFRVTDSDFRYIDFDAQQGGFVVAFDKINAEIKSIAVPVTDRKTSYEIHARLLQGRDQRPAEMSLSGWTKFGTQDTDAVWNLKGVFLPFFQPYYSKVTKATIEEGYLDSRATLGVVNKDLTGNFDFEIAGLLFGNYETDNALFGLKADEILSFLKDSAGRLKFQFTVRWNLADRSVSAREVIRKSIEHSLKNTVLGNVENILKKTIRKIADEGAESAQDNLETKIKKLKEFFKY